MNIIGISSHYHDAACCLLNDGRLVAAGQEERFTRIKNDHRLPVNAFSYCMDEAGISLPDVDVVAYYEQPEKRAERRQVMGLAALPWDPIDDIRRHLGFPGPVLTFPHHASHAASAFLFSPFETAAVLTVDGVGEWATTTFGRGDGATLETLREISFPHSLGLVYAALTSWLGFPINSGEGTVMGLAAHGEPRFLDHLRRLVRARPGGEFELDLDYFDFTSHMFSCRLCELIGDDPRPPRDPVTALHMDVAASLQALVEERLLDMCAALRAETGEKRLCLAGGVGLNAVANGRIIREGGFAEVFVQPAAGDAGGALGAAALAWGKLEGLRPAPLRNVFLGPSFDPEPILAATPLEPVDYRGNEEALFSEICERLASGQVVGWMQGRMEFGPRALGGRSILADPRRPEMAERLNAEIKLREWFRPFALSMLESQADWCLDLEGPSPFMLSTCAVTAELPAGTHVDGSTRPQTVDPGARFGRLLAAWLEYSGCPALLNTSLNGRGEPIVCSPVDGLLTFAKTGIDALVLEDWLISHVPSAWYELIPSWSSSPVQARQPDLYTF